MIVFLRWWVIVWLTVAGAGALLTQGGFQYIWAVDKTYLSFIIMGIFTVFTVFIGILTAQASKGNQSFVKHLPMCSYVATDVCQGLGMVGTLIGFLLLLQAVFTGTIDLASTTASQKVLADMGTGFATASVTTLVGLVCSLLLKAQLINLDYFLPEETK